MGSGNCGFSLLTGSNIGKLASKRYEKKQPSGFMKYS
jgi:hypothetical protein